MGKFQLLWDIWFKTPCTGRCISIRMNFNKKWLCLRARHWGQIPICCLKCVSKRSCDKKKRNWRNWSSPGEKPHKEIHQCRYSRSESTLKQQEMQSIQLSRVDWNRVQWGPRFRCQDTRAIRTSVMVNSRLWIKAQVESHHTTECNGLWISGGVITAYQDLSNDLCNDLIIEFEYET